MNDYIRDAASSIAGMLLAQLPAVERCNSQQSGFGSLQVEFFSTAWVASLTATISFAFTIFMQLALNQHLLVPEEAKFVCMKMGIQKFDKLLSSYSQSTPPPPQSPCFWRLSKDRHQSNSCVSLCASAHRIIVGHSFLYALEPSRYWQLNHKLRINFWNSCELIYLAGSVGK